jgi:tetratricopeptide (TPR) repeat protein
VARDPNVDVDGRPLSVRGDVIGGLFIVAVTFAVFGSVLSFEFLNWDDPALVLKNDRIRDFSFSGAVRWWTDPSGPDYFPLTEMSYAAEHRLAGERAGVYHGTNLAIHAGVSVLVFVLGRSVGLGILPAVFAGLLFSLHPIHVETVAWVAERKGLLAGLFALLSMVMFVRASQARAGWLLLIAANASGLAAMWSKAAAVSIGAVVFVLHVTLLGTTWKRGLWRALPLLVVGLAHAGFIFGLHHQAGNIRPGSFSDPLYSFYLSIYGAGFYLVKMVIPYPLVPVYPYPLDLSATDWRFLGSLTSLAALVVVAIRYRRHRWVVFGLGVYAASILPSLRMVQVGNMAVADRYMYWPSVGLCLMAGAGLLHIRRIGWMTGVGASALMVCGGLTIRQLPVWRNSESLWRHTLEHDPNSWVGHQNMGEVLAQRGAYAEAISHFEQAHALRPANWPNGGKALSNWGAALVKLERYGEAEAKLREAVEVNAENGEARGNLANAMIAQGKFEAAIDHFRAAIALGADGSARLQHGLGFCLHQTGRLEAGLAHYRAALLEGADDWRLHANLGNALVGLGRREEAVGHFERSLELRRDQPEFREMLEKLRSGITPTP